MRSIRQNLTVIARQTHYNIRVAGNADTSGVVKTSIRRTLTDETLSR